MGILNITPDSFSDGGLYLDKERAIERAFQMADEGADIIDIGGISTRPGSLPIPEKEELKRVIPVLKSLVGRIKKPISIDTYSSRVAEECLKNGADIINDISGLRFSSDMADVVSRFNAGVVIMHIKGTPRDMQDNPTSQGFFFNILEPEMEIEVILKRPGGEERAPTILVNKDSVSLGYIFQKGERPASPDRYEPNNTSEKATIITEEKISASIWDGIVVKPIDLDWYSFTMENYGRFEIEVTSIDEKSSLLPSLKLYNDKLKLLAQTKAVKTAKIGWSGKGKFFILVENSKQTEGPDGHRYVLSIKK